MEAKLKEYRALKRRQELIENTKEKLKKTKEKVITSFSSLNFLSDMTKSTDDENLLDIPQENENFQTELDPPDDTDIQEADEEDEELEESVYCFSKFALYLGLWFMLFLFFVSLQFGAVFFAISLLFVIYINTRTRPKKKGEPSAYSVFNKNCESIDGTIKAEDLQRQMLFGPVGML